VTIAITPSAGVAVPDSSRLATTENLDAAGEKFEALFIGMMLKSMRQAKLGNDLFDSQAIDQFREMQDKKVAETMAAHAPLGIGKAMTEFLSRNQPDLQKPDEPVP
jgi:flagellar protein FlgJ